METKEGALRSYMEGIKSDAIQARLMAETFELTDSEKESLKIATVKYLADELDKVFSASKMELAVIALQNVMKRMENQKKDDDSDEEDN